MAARELRTVALLKNHYVEDEERGNGHGNALMQSFMAEVSMRGAEAIILVADFGATQQEGFVLEQWHEEWEFGAHPDIFWATDVLSGGASC